MTISSGLLERIRTTQPFELTGFGGVDLFSLCLGFISKPISVSRNPAEDQYKKFVVTCWAPKISKADLPSRKKPGTRNAQLPASMIRNRSRRDDLLCPDIQQTWLSSWRAEEDLGQNYELFPPNGAVLTQWRELLLR